MEEDRGSVGYWAKGGAVHAVVSVRLWRGSGAERIWSSLAHGRAVFPFAAIVVVAVLVICVPCRERIESEPVADHAVLATASLKTLTTGLGRQYLLCPATWVGRLVGRFVGWSVSGFVC